MPHATELPRTPITAREPGWKRLHPPPRGVGRDGPPSTSAGMSLGKTGMPDAAWKQRACRPSALGALELLELSRELEEAAAEKATECCMQSAPTLKIAGHQRLICDVIWAPRVVCLVEARMLVSIKTESVGAKHRLTAASHPNEDAAWLGHCGRRLDDERGIDVADE